MKTLAVTTLPTTENQHSHEHHQLVIPVAGQADFNIEGKRGRIAHSVGCAIPSQSTHAFSGHSGNQLVLINIDCGDLTEDLTTMFACPAWFRIDRSLMELIHQVSHELALFPDDAQLANALCEGLLRSLQLRFAQSWQPVATATLAMDQICEYVSTHLEHSLPVADLASLAGMGESRFYDAFRDFTSATPHQYILNLRLKAACKLLSETNDSLADIAERVGFTSQSLMTRSMRERLNITPLRYRKQHHLLPENLSPDEVFV
ncbi:AraC family transcriptional regulator [Parendozoicomonas sp. Alg238-R29]|uniref:helix-turn-helix domain-containing protein n=1 Tax=Parendozoicomonas sp. Alg238-R29 TaxID=2993446 RepID=UPI00248D6DCC|nr:AraC family transcriptional regulator [Parendozoicomonas sp. Alg238-R29]